MIVLSIIGYVVLFATVACGELAEALGVRSSMAPVYVMCGGFALGFLSYGAAYNWHQQALEPALLYALAAFALGGLVAVLRRRFAR